jgi:hypothetical protein
MSAHQLRVPRPIVLIVGLARAIREAPLTEDQRAALAVEIGDVLRQQVDAFGFATRREWLAACEPFERVPAGAR